MFQKTSLTTIIVGVFIVYVLHTCWVMYGIVYTKPCEKPRGDNCISPYLAGKPRLQVSIMHRLTFPMLSHMSLWFLSFHLYVMNMTALHMCLSCS